MKENNKLALFIAYFLSRFNEEAYEYLQYGTQRKTHETIGKTLDVNPHTVKNMRDEFDPLFGFRAGWYQKPMVPSREKVVQDFKNFGFKEISELAKDILFNEGKGINSDVLIDIIEIDEKTKGKKRQFSTRGVTGKEAERLFRDNFKQIIPDFEGLLIETTNDGCGYDFKNSLESMFIEVKGSIDDKLSILLTNKEWEVAAELEDKYYIVIIYSLKDTPFFTIVNNPSKVLKPELTTSKAISINWNVSHNQIKEFAVDSMSLIIERN